MRRHFILAAYKSNEISAKPQYDYTYIPILSKKRVHLTKGQEQSCTDNEQRDYRIFEVFAFFMSAEAQEADTENLRV